MRPRQTFGNPYHNADLMGRVVAPTRDLSSPGFVDERTWFDKAVYNTVTAVEAGAQWVAEQWNSFTAWVEEKWDNTVQWVGQNLDGLQDALGSAGMIPGVGVIPDLINTAVYAVRGKWQDAALSLAGAIPVAGDIFAAGNKVRKVANAADTVRTVDNVVSTLRTAEKTTDTAKAVNRTADAARSAEVAATVRKADTGATAGRSFDAPDSSLMRRGMPTKSATMSAEEAGKWERYLDRRGVTIKHDQDAFLDKLDVNLEGLYDPHVKTMYLRTDPSKSAFLEEAFHARQHLSRLPDTMEYNGRTIDRWEFEAQRSLIRNRHRLGIPNDQTRQTIDNLRRVYDGSY